MVILNGIHGIFCGGFFQEEPQRSQSLQQNESEAARAERLRQRQQEELRAAARLQEMMRQQEAQVRDHHRIIMMGSS